MVQVVVDKLSKVYGNDSVKITALKEVCFQIEKGEFVVILGASGAGKSTLLNLLGGMDYASDGKYLIDNREISSYDSKKLGKFRREDIGFVFQFYNLMPNLTALENVQLAESVAKNASISSKVLEQVGLKERAGNFPAQLSGGEQQRVAIARAIVKNPTLLLCDEPTGALDSKTGQSIIKLLYNICKQDNKTVIIVTHNEKLKDIADHLIVLHDGKIIENVLNKNPMKVDELEC